jgi:hypothetical protein
MGNVIHLDFGGNKVRVLNKEKLCPSAKESGEHDDNVNTFDEGETAFFHDVRESDSNGLGAEIMRQVIDGLEDQIGNYGMIMDQRLELIGQLALHVINSDDSLEFSAPNIEKIIKSRLREIYPTLSNKKRNHIYRGIKFHLLREYGMHA